MITSIRHTLLSALLGAGAIASAQAGTLDYQGIAFTSSSTGKVLTLEIDAAHPAGNWTTATTLGALQLKDIGAFDNVTLSAAPGGVANWTLSGSELNANGCGGGGHAGKSLCLSGNHVALSDNMIFKFTFSGGAPDLSSPLVKLNLLGDKGGRKVGNLVAGHIPPGSAQAPAPAPVPLPGLTPTPEPVPVLAPTPAQVPEPQGYAMMIAGLAVMGAVSRRRKAKR